MMLKIWFVSYRTHIVWFEIVETVAAGCLQLFSNLYELGTVDWYEELEDQVGTFLQEGV